MPKKLHAKLHRPHSRDRRCVAVTRLRVRATTAIAVRALLCDQCICSRLLVVGWLLLLIAATAPVPLPPSLRSSFVCPSYARPATGGRREVRCLLSTVCASCYRRPPGGALSAVCCLLSAACCLLLLLLLLLLPVLLLLLLLPVLLLLLLLLVLLLVLLQLLLLSSLMVLLFSLFLRCYWCCGVSIIPLPPA
jgi:hypothetical protein